MSRIDMSRRYRKNDQLICGERGGKLVLIDPYRRMRIELNPTAEKIWELLDGEHSAAGIVDALKAEFDVDAGSLKRDVDCLLKDLLKREMII